MKHQRTLTIASLVSILLFSLHWADEIARGIEPGTISRAWGGLLILLVWVCATLVLEERRSGLVIVLIGSILAVGVPVIHMQDNGLIGGRITANSSGALFWVWTNIALAVSGLTSGVLAARALWSSTRGLKLPGRDVK